MLRNDFHFYLDTTCSLAQDGNEGRFNQNIISIKIQIPPLALNGCVTSGRPDNCSEPQTFTSSGYFENYIIEHI